MAKAKMRKNLGISDLDNSDSDPSDTGLEDGVRGLGPGVGQLQSSMRKFIDGGGHYTDAIGAILSTLSDQLRESARVADQMDDDGNPQGAALLQKDRSAWQGLQNALMAAAGVSNLLEYDEALREEEETEEPALAFAANRRRR